MEIAIIIFFAAVIGGGFVSRVLYAAMDKV
jgi:hypothetical protein